MLKIITFSLFALTADGFGPDNWTPLIEDGAVITFRQDVESSSHDAYRADGKICATESELMELFDDPQLFTAWLPRTEAVEVLEADPTLMQKTVHVVSDAPFPLRSRDMVYRITALPDLEAGTVQVNIEGLADRIPPQKGLVRIRAAQGAWFIRFHDGYVDAQFALHLDMGRMPAMLAARSLHHAVRDSIANLQNRYPCQP